ncbi:MAG: hypothetical protein EXR94_00735 [Gemmatimonadetes bacterium]|nr:hypothetical protein [Gemmatimonadota bacterium]
MLILLVRHALAADRDGARYPLDSDRPLVAKGKKTQAHISRRLARETGTDKKRRVASAPLAQDTNLAAIAEAVGPRTADEVVALVGHEPWMSELASVLLTGSASRLAVRFDKSGVMGIEAPTIAAAAGRLVFFTPTSP